MSSAASFTTRRNPGNCRSVWGVSMRTGILFSRSSADLAARRTTARLTPCARSEPGDRSQVRVSASALGAVSGVCRGSASQVHEGNGCQRGDLGGDASFGSYKHHGRTGPCPDYTGTRGQTHWWVCPPRFVLEYQGMQGVVLPGRWNTGIRGVKGERVSRGQNVSRETLARGQSGDPVTAAASAPLLVVDFLFRSGNAATGPGYPCSQAVAV